MCTKKRGLAVLIALLVASALLVGTHTGLIPHSQYGWISRVWKRGDGHFLHTMNWRNSLSSIAQVVTTPGPSSKLPLHGHEETQTQTNTATKAKSSKAKSSKAKSSKAKNAKVKSSKAKSSKAKSSKVKNAKAKGISTVYPPSHYGKDLCLLFDHKHNKGKPTKTYKHPNVVHYVKIVDNKHANAALQLLDYASIVSVDMNYKPDKIVIHSNKKMTGELWERAKKLNTKIEEKYVDRAQTIGKYHKPAKAITHEADVRKIEIAMKEGGIVMDFDVIILDGDNLRRQQASAECVLSIERECTFINAGFISCMPNTALLGKWWQGYQDDYRNTWPAYLYNCGEVPAKILRNCPSCYDVYLDPEICQNPDAGAPGGPGPGRDPWKVKNGVQWRNKTVVHVLLHHLNMPKDNGLLKLWDCSYKELVMHILGDSYKQFLP